MTEDDTAGTQPAPPALPDAPAAEPTAPPAPVPPPDHPHAHTASGREILGWWGWFERGVMVLTFGSIILGVVAFLIDFEDRKQARRVNAETLAAYEEQATVNAATLREIEDSRAARQQEAITRAWSILTTAAPGNSGKIAALEYLHGQVVPLTGIDLSCARMGGGWNAERRDCDSRTWLKGVQLPEAVLTGAHLEGADLWFAHLEGADLEDAHLEGAVLMDAHLEGADLWDAHLEGANLWRAHLEGAYLSGAHLEGAHLSGADFTDAMFIDHAVFRNPETGETAWAWANDPPKGLPDGRVTLCVHEFGLSFFTRPDPCVAPGP